MQGKLKNFVQNIPCLDAIKIKVASPAVMSNRIESARLNLREGDPAWKGNLNQGRMKKLHEGEIRVFGGSSNKPTKAEKRRARHEVFRGDLLQSQYDRALDHTDGLNATMEDIDYVLRHMGELGEVDADTIGRVRRARGNACYFS